MALQFAGKGSPLTDAGVTGAAGRLGPGALAAHMWAVFAVETAGCGFLSDRRPKILFERHVFSRLTDGRFDDDHPDLSNPDPGGYGAGEAHQHDRLDSAIALDRKAALMSASWGIGQIMGYNFASAGYPDVESMVTAMVVSEDVQLAAVSAFVVSNNLNGHLINQEWDDFAAGYNGPNYEDNDYAGKLQDAFAKYRNGGPDLRVRTAQICLAYLGCDPGPIDGTWGDRTREAMNSFLGGQGASASDELTDAILASLKQQAGV